MVLRCWALHTLLLCVCCCVCDLWFCTLACVCWVAQACVCTLGCGKQTEGTWPFVWLCPRGLCSAASSPAKGSLPPHPSLVSLPLPPHPAPPYSRARPLVFSAAGPWAGLQQPCEGENGAGRGCCGRGSTGGGQLVRPSLSEAACNPGLLPRSWPVLVTRSSHFPPGAEPPHF